MITITTAILKSNFFQFFILEQEIFRALSTLTIGMEKNDKDQVIHIK